MTTISNSRALAAPLAVMVFFFACSIAAAGEGYKPEQQDTRPVKQQPAPAKAGDDHAGHDHAANSPDDSADDANETPFPDPKVTFDFHDLELLCVQEGGRKKPLHTLVSEQIEQLVGRPVFATTPYIVDKISGRKVGGTELFVSIFLQPDEWKAAPIVLVAYRPLKEHLGLKVEEKHFSPRRLARHPKLIGLWESADVKRRAGDEKALSDLEKEAEIIQKRLGFLGGIMQGTRTFSLVPHPSDSKGKWLTLEDFQSSFSGESKPYYSPEKAKVVFEKFMELVDGFSKREPQKFSKAAQEFRSTLIGLSSSVYPNFDTLDREVTYNSLRPFGRAWMFYLAAVAVGAIALRVKGKPAYYVMMALFLGGMLFHVYGFALRCLIAGRPPVSNMYESVIWVGFGAVFFGLIFEMIYKRRYFAVCGAAMGFICLALMDLAPVYSGNAKMTGFSNEISPLVPVLRDNFWLTIHVLTITLSYAAFMLTWALGHVTLFKHLFNPGAKAEQHELHTFVYRAMQVGVLLLAIGTILGGVWAYYSWGRFWGWDPKETWAFIALMCYLFVLHGRFTGWWGNFGMSVGSVVCFQAVVMAWYGVNFVLGNSLHSYGTGAGGQGIVLSVVALDAVFTFATILRHATYKMPAVPGGPGGPGAPQAEAAEQELTSVDPITEVRAGFSEPSTSAGE